MKNLFLIELIILYSLTYSVAYPGFCFGGWESVKQQGKNFFFMAVFFGGKPRPLKGYHAPPAGGPGGEGPPDGSEVSFFQTMQSIRK